MLSRYVFLVLRGDAVFPQEHPLTASTRGAGGAVLYIAFELRDAEMIRLSSGASGAGRIERAWARSDDLQARREEVAVRPLPAQGLLGLRGRRDDRGSATALHDVEIDRQYTDTARRLHRRLRLLPHARLQPAAPAEERRLGTPVPADGRPGREVAEPGAASADQPKPNTSCGASPAGDPSIPPPARSKNSRGRCVRRSSATTSPTPTCAASTTTASRS